jgi:hypothetical protein
MANKHRKNYILYTLRKGSWIDTDKSIKWRPEYLYRDQLIRHIALHEVYYKSESILNNLVNSMENYTLEELCNADTKLYYICKLVGTEEIIKVDINTLLPEVMVEVDKIKLEKEQRLKNSLAYVKARDSYEFRYDPVPFVHNYNNHHIGDYYRHPHINRIIHSAEYVEYKEFRKGKERKENMPTWDDRPRHRDRSWKTSYKVEKQWMKHCRKHVETKNFDKRALSSDDIYIETELELDNVV